jgi:hypothetical protein
MLVRAFPLMLAATVVVSAPVVAQSSPRETADRFIAAWDQRDWSEAANLLDLDLFDKFRQDFVDRARRQSESSPGVSVDDLLRQNPGMPRDVAEYQVRMIRQQRERYADPAPFEFARVGSLDELERLSPVDAAARWLESRDPSWQIRMQFQAAGCRPPSDADDVPPVHRHLIGIVDEDDSTSYALFREQRADDDQAPASIGGDVFVMVLHRNGSRWKVVPRSDLLPEVGMVDTRDCR